MKTMLIKEDENYFSYKSKYCYKIYTSKSFSEEEMSEKQSYDLSLFDLEKSHMIIEAKNSAMAFSYYELIDNVKPAARNNNTYLISSDILGMRLVEDENGEIFFAYIDPNPTLVYSIKELGEAVEHEEWE